MKPRLSLRCGFAAAVLVGFHWSLAPRASAGGLEEALARLEAAVVQEMKPGPTPRQDNKAATLAMLLARLHGSIDTGRWQDAIAQVNHFADQEKSPAVLEIYREVRQELLKKIAHREQEQIAAIEAAIVRAGERCLAAQSAADLDAVLQELAMLRPGIENYHPEPLRSAYTRLDGARHFVGRWQDSLAKAAAGDAYAAAALMAELVEKSKTELVPRSAMLARIEQLRATAASATAAGSASALQQGAASIKEIEALHSRIEQRASAAPNDKEASALLQQVRMLRNGYAELRSGRYGSALQSCLQTRAATGPVSDEIVELQQQLLLAVLPRYLATDDRLEREPGEKVDAVLQRHLREARDKHDWAAALRAAEALRLTGFQGSAPPPWLEADIIGYSAIVAGTQNEFAGFFSEAMANYQTALKQPGETLPLAWLSERVKALRARHAAPARSPLPGGR